jgi:hypothetical protein
VSGSGQATLVPEVGPVALFCVLHYSVAAFLGNVTLVAAGVHPVGNFLLAEGISVGQTFPVFYSAADCECDQ